MKAPGVVSHVSQTSIEIQRWRKVPMELLHASIWRSWRGYNHLVGRGLTTSTLSEIMHDGIEGVKREFGDLGCRKAVYLYLEMMF
jgi:hypothetical protein